MKIGVDARVLTFPELRGIANYVLEIFRYWPEADDEFILFHESGTITSQLQSSAKIKAVRVPEPPGTRFKVWQWLGLPKALKELSLDVFWAPANIPVVYSACPQVLTVHDTLLQEKFRKHVFFDRFYYRYIVPFWAKKYVNCIITVSSFSKGRIQNLFNLGSERITIIHNGLPSVSSPFCSKESAFRFLLAEKVVDSPYFYALGASSSWKNTELLLKSFAQVVREMPNTTLVVSGIQNNVMQKYANLVAGLGLDKQVKLMGFIGNDTRNALYQGAQAFIYPSLFEGFGFPPVEAMALGCPVIASNRASIPEVVGNAALLVDCTSEEALAAAIIDLAQNEGRQDELIRLGYENISRFDWEKCAIQHRDVFLKCVQQ